jgi:RNase H-like domain found in reverse transcriptase
VDKQERKGKLMRWGRLSQHETERIQRKFAASWTPQCQETFDAIKDLLSTAPVLAMPDFAKHLEVVADASDIAVGAVLMQEGRPCAYYSKKLSSTETLYSASDREMLAVTYALREWRCYLEGCEFTIVTDHEPNTYLEKSTNPHTVRRRAHWLEDTRGFQYRWCFRPGRVNVADPLSRIPSTPEHAHQCMLPTTQCRCM